MNWFRENPFWGAFAAIAGGALLIALGLVWWTKSNFEDALAQFRNAASEQGRLENGNPYPGEANVRKMKTYLDAYKVTLDKLKAELKTHELPEAPLAPNEFQTRLRQAITRTIDNARVHRVRLPDKFTLGFEEFVSSLPSTEDAPRLGQELAQIQLLLDTIIESRVDAITAFHRIAHPVAPAATPAAARSRVPQKPPSGPKLIEQRTVEFSISAPPSAARKVVNQIAAASDQFFIIRTLYVKNQKDKGPARASALATAGIPPNPVPAAAASPTSSATPAAPLNFIVGNEHIDLSARVELVTFTF